MNRIFILLEQEETRSFLSDLLKSNYTLIFANQEQSFKQPFDLCIIDDSSLHRYAQKIQMLKAAQLPVLLPVLLLTSRQNVKMFAINIWQLFDELIIEPIEKIELLSRINNLLQNRKLSLQLEKSLQHERQLTKNLERLNYHLQKLSVIEPLTQIANRHYFEDFLDREWKRLAREQQWLSLIFCNLDFFKSYYDLYGQIAADHCLQKVAYLLSEVTKRPADLTAHYGGEEFVLILPNTPNQGAIHLAQIIQTKLKMEAIHHAGSLVSQLITLSMGIASIMPCLDVSPDILIAAATQALSEAKQAGYNCFISKQLTASSEVSSSLFQV